MAEKGFGVNEINLIGQSGTPSIESPNNLNIDANTVAISTDVSIGGEVVSNVIVGSGYSVGIGTTSPNYELHVVGDVKVTGILTVGSSSIEIDGANNQIKVGTALTLSHSSGVRIGSSNLHSTGLEVGSINATDIKIGGNSVGLGSTGPQGATGVIGATGIQGATGPSGGDGVSEALIIAYATAL